MRRLSTVAPGPSVPSSADHPMHPRLTAEAQTNFLQNSPFASSAVSAMVPISQTLPVPPRGPSSAVAAPTEISVSSSRFSPTGGAAAAPCQHGKQLRIPKQPELRNLKREAPIFGFPAPAASELNCSRSATAGPFTANADMPGQRNCGQRANSGPDSTTNCSARLPISPTFGPRAGPSPTEDTTQLLQVLAGMGVDLSQFFSGLAPHPVAPISGKVAPNAHCPLQSTKFPVASRLVDPAASRGSYHNFSPVTTDSASGSLPSLLSSSLRGVLPAAHPLHRIDDKGASFLQSQAGLGGLPQKGSLLDHQAMVRGLAGLLPPFGSQGTSGNFADLGASSRGRHEAATNFGSQRVKRRDIRGPEGTNDEEWHVPDSARKTFSRADSIAPNSAADFANHFVKEQLLGGGDPGAAVALDMQLRHQDVGPVMMPPPSNRMPIVPTDFLHRTDDAAGAARGQVWRPRSGVPGVHWATRPRGWVASWKEQGKRLVKYFPVSQFGPDEALRLAIAFKQSKHPGPPGRPPDLNTPESPAPPDSSPTAAPSPVVADGLKPSPLPNPAAPVSAVTTSNLKSEM